MRLPNRVTKILVAKMLLRSMTGKLTDLQRVLSLAHRIGDTGLGDFLEALACDSFTQGGLAQLFLRLGRECSALCKKKLVQNLVCNWGLDGPRIRESLQRQGIHAPSHIVISPRSDCNEDRFRRDSDSTGLAAGWRTTRTGCPITRGQFHRHGPWLRAQRGADR